MNKLFNLYIKLKIFYSKLFKKINFNYDYEKRLIKDRIKNKENLDQFVLQNYKKDKLLFLHFDWQKDAMTTFYNGGDCNSLHRVAQIYYSINADESYLFTYLASNFNKSHSFCVFKCDNNYFIYDYGNIIGCGKGFINIFDIKKYVYQQYKTIIIAYCIQDIDFKIKLLQSS